MATLANITRASLKDLNNVLKQFTNYERWYGNSEPSLHALHTIAAESPGLVWNTDGTFKLQAFRDLTSKVEQRYFSNASSSVLFRAANTVRAFNKDMRDSIPASDNEITASHTTIDPK